MKYLFRLVIGKLYSHYPWMANYTIERCAASCERNARDNDRVYWELRSTASNPDDMDILKWAAWSGQANRDAATIRGLKHG